MKGSWSSSTNGAMRRQCDLLRGDSDREPGRVSGFDASPAFAAKAERWRLVNGR